MFKLLILGFAVLGLSALLHVGYIVAILVVIIVALVA